MKVSILQKISSKYPQFSFGGFYIPMEKAEEVYEILKDENFVVEPSPVSFKIHPEGTKWYNGKIVNFSVRLQ